MPQPTKPTDNNSEDDLLLSPMVLVVFCFFRLLGEEASTGMMDAVAGEEAMMVVNVGNRGRFQLLY